MSRVTKAGACRVSAATPRAPRRGRRSTESEVRVGSWSTLLGGTRLSRGVSLVPPPVGRMRRPAQRHAQLMLVRSRPPSEAPSNGLDET